MSNHLKERYKKVIEEQHKEELLESEKPLSEWDDDGDGGDGKSSEVEYVLHEMKKHARLLDLRLKELVEKTDFVKLRKGLLEELQNAKTTLWLASEKTFATDRETKAAFIKLTKEIEAKYVNVSELFNLKKYATTELEKVKLYNEVVEISAADLKTLNATPITLIASPGEGNYIEIKRLELFLDYETAAYTAVDAGKDLSIEYATSGQIIEIETTGFLDQSSDQRRCSHHAETHLVGVDEDVVVKMLSGEVATGDSPLKLSIDYRVVEALS